VEIEIRLWGSISYYLPEGRGKFFLKKSVEPGTTVQKLVEELNLPKQLYFLITVNGRTIESEYTLEEGDEVALFQPTSGG
jgi:sulfur carrier protein ThiS